MAFQHQAMLSRFSLDWNVSAAQTPCRERLEILHVKRLWASINSENAAAIAPD
jgi:hypothetical protein